MTYPGSRGIAPLVIVIGIAVVAALGGGVYVATRDSAPEEAPRAEGEGIMEENGEMREEFLVLDTDLRATIVQTKAGATIGEGTMEYDGTGNWHMTYEADGMASEVIFADGNAFFKNPENGAWLMMPDLSVMSETAAFAPDDYTVTEADISEWEQQAEYQGTESCGGPSGTCDIYTLTEPESGESMIWIDTRTRTMVHFVNVFDDLRTEVDYTATGSVDVQAPESYEEFNMNLPEGVSIPSL